MHYRWKDGRIVLKIAIWGAMEGDARDILDRIAGRMRHLAATGEADSPMRGRAAGLQRNGDVTRVDEEDRRMSIFMAHPPADTEGSGGPDPSNFDGHPVDYKCLAPHAPVEGNRAFDSAVRGADGVLLVVDARREKLDFARAAVDAMLRRMAARPDAADLIEESEDAGEAGLETFFGPDGAYGLVTYVMRGAESDATDVMNGEELREALDLPANCPILEADPAAPNDSALEAFLALAASLRPILERAEARNRIP